jgi:hypothetical protein
MFGAFLGGATSELKAEHCDFSRVYGQTTATRNSLQPMAINKPKEEVLEGAGIE